MSAMALNKAKGSVLEFEGSNFLRARLLLSCLSGKAIRIRRIREHADDPGLNEHEASVIRLFDKITNGSKVEVSETGTALFFQPGILVGGKIEHDCSLQRGIGYYLEPLMALGAFCKHPLNVTLRGVTNNKLDPSPDFLKASAMPILKRYFLVDEGLELKVQKRGAAPGGGGQVHFRCPIRKSLRAQMNVDQGKIKRIRGVAWATRVSPAVANRLVESAKGVLLQFIPDIYIYSDHHTGAKSGKSPGFGLVLTAETTKGVFFSAEVCSNPASSKADGHDRPEGGPTVPEDLGVEGAHALLEEVYRGGCIDSTSQSLQFLLMALSQQDVSKVITGPLSTYSVHFLRHIRDFFGITFKIEDAKVEDSEDLQLGGKKVELSCLGLGFTNLSKRTT